MKFTFTKLLWLVLFIVMPTMILQSQTVTQTWTTLPSTSFYPLALTIDGSGNVYVVSYNSNYIISKITASGTATPVWATLASDANVKAIIKDASGNLYTANAGNNTVSKITAAGVVTQAWATLATGAGPNGLAIDISGNVYTANLGNNTISKITTGGSVTQAWAALPNFTNPQAIAVDGSGNVYTANGFNTVSKVTSSGTLTAAWATLGTGAGPNAMIIDGSGNLYISNNPGGYTATVSKVTAAGTVTTAWATLAANASPRGIAIDPSGNVYTINNGNNNISKITSGGTLTQAWATLGAGAGGVGIAADASGNIYTANYSGHTISKINTSGTVTAAWATLIFSASPRGVAIDASGNIYVANSGNSTISKIHPAGTILQTWTLANGATPYGITIDASGNVYTANYDNNTVSKIDASGTLTDPWATLATGANPKYIITDASGNVYTGNWGNNTISKITASGTATPAWATTAYNAGPYGIAVDTSGNVYAANNGTTNTISKTTPSGVTTLAWAALSSATSPSALVIDTSGNVYSANYASQNISKVTPAGVVTEAWVNLSSAVPPNIMTIDASNNIYVISQNSNIISKITAAGVKADPWVTLAAGATYGIAVDASGNAYITNTYNNTVSKIVPASNSWTGNTNTDWNTATNWFNGTVNAVPAGIDNVVIPPVTNQPVIDGSTIAAVNNLTVNSGASLSINGTLQVHGSITYSGGTLTASGGTMVLNGTAAQTIPAITYENLTLSGSGTKTLGGNVSLYHTLNIGNGTILALGTSKFTLLSNAASTAAVAPMGTGQITYGSGGGFIVQRYIPAHAARAYTLVSSPVSSPTIYNSWQESGAAITGYGTQISGASAGNGFDFASAAGIASIYYYDDTQTPGSKWVGLSGTNSTVLSAGKGYLLFVRGDRTVGAGSGAPMATTLRATGTLTTGTVHFATSGGSAGTAALHSGANLYNLAANPYAASIKWTTLTKNNLSGSFTVYDPNLASFVTSDGTTVAPSISQQQANIIQSGQAFFVQNDASGNTPDFGINETDKNTGAATGTANTVFGMQAPTTQLNINFYKAGNIFADGAVAVFGNEYKKTEDSKDADKFTNFGETISFAENNNRSLSIDARPLPQLNDTLFIDMKQMTVNTAYTIVVDGKGFNSSNLQSATLTDKVTGTNTSLDLSALTSYPFTTTAASEAGRLYIVLSGKPVVTVPPPATDSSSNSNALQVTLLGNPVKDHISIQYIAQQAGNTTIRLINANGQAMTSMSLGVQQQGNVTIPVTQYAGGMYLVEVTVGSNKAMIKVVKN